jgi:hypothetical protein
MGKAVYPRSGEELSDGTCVKEGVEEAGTL